MRFQKFTGLVEAGEGLHVEFKRQVTAPTRFAHEMIAFANTSGGVILVGVDDDGTVVGVKSEKEELEIIEQAAALSRPPLTYHISFVSVGKLDVVCVEVPESAAKPHFHVEAGEDGPRCYIRVGEKSMQASREMIKVLQHQAAGEPVRLIIGEAERRLLQHLETHEQITVQGFAHLTNISSRRASRLLIRLVRAGILAIHTNGITEVFTLLRDPLSD